MLACIPSLLGYGKVAGLDTCNHQLWLRTEQNVCGSISMLQVGGRFPKSVYISPAETRLFLLSWERWIFNNCGVILNLIIHWLEPPFLLRWSELMLPIWSEGLVKASCQKNTPPQLWGSNLQYRSQTQAFLQTELSCLGVNKWALFAHRPLKTRLLLTRREKGDVWQSWSNINPIAWIELNWTQKALTLSKNYKTRIICILCSNRCQWGLSPISPVKYQHIQQYLFASPVKFMMRHNWLPVQADAHSMNTRPFLNASRTSYH